MTPPVLLTAGGSDRRPPVASAGLGYDFAKSPVPMNDLPISSAHTPDGSTGST